MNEVKYDFSKDYYRTLDYLFLKKNQIEHKLMFLLDREKIDYLSITSRIKQPQSVKNKMVEHELLTVGEVWDLIGVRVVLKRRQEIARVKEIIKKYFYVIEERNKKPTYPDSFGYESIHEIIGLSNEHISINAEIQIKTAFQNVWSEIEHDLGYKHADELTNHDRREFAKIAALMDLADDVLSGIEYLLPKNKVYTKYKQTMVNIKGKTLNNETLGEFIDRNKLRNSGPTHHERLTEYQHLITERIGSRLFLKQSRNGMPNHNALDICIKRLKAVGITDISKLNYSLSFWQDENNDLMYKIGNECFIRGDLLPVYVLPYCILKNDLGEDDDLKAFIATQFTNDICTDVEKLNHRLNLIYDVDVSQLLHKILS